MIHYSPEVALIRSMVEVLEGLPDKAPAACPDYEFCMDTYTPSADHACATACCLAGLACILGDGKGEFLGMSHWSTAHRARTLLEMDFEVAQDLFDPAGVMVNYRDLTPVMASRVLRGFLRTGVVDWAGAVEACKGE